MFATPPSAAATAAVADDARRWSLHVSLPNEGTRDELVFRYQGLARLIAAHCYRRRYAEELEFADYLQFAMIGLLESIDRYDPSAGVKFETFAGRRVKGAVLSGVEGLCERQRQAAVRREIKSERARSLASGVAPSKQAGDALQRLTEVAIGLALGFMLEDTGMFVDGEPARASTPYEQVELAELRQRIRELVEQLPGVERRVLHYHYYQQIPFAETASMLGLTKARVSQIHRSALQRLRQLHDQFGRVASIR